MVLPIVILAIVLTATPYIAMKLLTNFENGESSKSQRSWLMAWLALSQFLGPSGYLMYTFPQLGFMDGFWMSFYILYAIVVFSVGSIGGLVVVGKMIVDDQVCVKL